MKTIPVAIALYGLLLVFNATAQSPVSVKKGIGLAERHGLGAAQLEALHVGWYYNWGSESALTTTTRFVPMLFSEKRLHERISGDVVLGYNEPDHKKQANIPAASALAHWPEIASKAKLIGSPAMAGNPLKSEWFSEFMQGRPKVDFITVHWYKGADAEHLIRDLEEIHAKFGLPVWVTEFAPQTAGDSAKEPEKFTQTQVDRFIKSSTRWMEKTPWLERYAWHDSKTGTSAVFDESGGLTATGRTYADLPSP